MERLTEARDEGLRGRSVGVRNVIESVRNHLQGLLNTRRVRDAVSDDFRECQNSLLTFGLPDYSGINVRNPEECESLRQTVEEAIMRFETRLRSVSVSVEPSEDTIPLLHFRVNAILQVEPNPEEISFDTVLESASGRFVVREGR